MTLPELKTHLAEQIALADAPQEVTETQCVRFISNALHYEDLEFGTHKQLRLIQEFLKSPLIASARTNHPKLCRQLQVALEEIESGPHSEHCSTMDIWYPNKRCTCWKSRAIDRITEAGV